MKKPPIVGGLEALRASEERLRAIMDTIVDAVITIDERGIIHDFNPAAERMFDYKASEIIGKSVNLLMLAPHNASHDKYVKRYLRTGRARIVGIGREVTGLRCDGSTFPMDLAVSEVKLGKRRLFTGIARDVTDRKQAEEMITRISEMERRQFGQELHDGLGQQLTGLSLLAKTLENKLTRDRVARAEAAEIAALSSRILDEVKLQAHGLYPIELERHGLSAAMSALSYMQERLFRVGCTYECSTDLPPMETHEALHLYRISQEAVSNAIKHGQAKHIRIRLEKSGEVLKLSVEDDGSGMPPDAERKGGMGLSIMRYRANTLGAKMEFRRGPRKGTLVTCTWYMADRKQSSSKRDGRHGQKR
ncbi:MAG: PAS domain S-box protein [bacterium]